MACEYGDRVYDVYCWVEFRRIERVRSFRHDQIQKDVGGKFNNPGDVIARCPVPAWVVVQATGKVVARNRIKAVVPKHRIATSA